MRSIFSRLFCCLSICFVFFCSSALAQNCGSISLSDIANTGPFAYQTMDQNDGLRNGPDYGNATVYFPENASRPIACVAIVPGFVSVQSSVAAWGPFLASHGIASIIIDTNSIFDQPDDRADALLDALETMRQENTRSASPLFGLIDTNRFAVMGWSMGGGGAQLAAVIDPSIKAVIALAPWLSFPTTSDLNHSVPVLIFSGEVDATAPPAIHSDLHYLLTPSTTDKLLFELASAGHSIANDPANANNVIGQYGLAWLRYYLLEDPCHCSLAITPSSITSSNLTNVVCPSLVPCPIQQTLFNNLIADGNYKAIQTLTSMSLVPLNGVVSMKAGQSVTLDPGFSAITGSTFEAYIGNCP